MAELLNEKRDFINWVLSLMELDDQLWFQSFSEGKWATADVISHFITWDNFFLEHRIPYIQQNIPFPQMDINTEAMNRDASKYARSGISKQEVIKEFIEARSKVIQWLEELPEDAYMRMLHIGKNEIELISYFQSHHHHDITHKKQIVDFLKTQV